MASCCPELRFHPEDTPPRPAGCDYGDGFAFLPPSPGSGPAGWQESRKGGVWCGAARPGWRTCPWDSLTGSGLKASLAVPWWMTQG